MYKNMNENKYFEFNTPEYLFCELPIKDGTLNDSRVWVYCPRALTLIEMIALDDLGVHNLQINQERKYRSETWGIAVVQNNCEATGADVGEIIDGAWDFFCKYIEWEDQNVDNSGKNILN